MTFFLRNVFRLKEKNSGNTSNYLVSHNTPTSHAFDIKNASMIALITIGINVELSRLPQYTLISPFIFSKTDARRF